MKKYVYYLSLLLMALPMSCSDYSSDDELDFSHNNLSDVAKDSSFVTEAQARKIANGLSCITRSGGQKFVSDVVALCDAHGDTLMYVANYFDAQGYMVISATRNYHPVLAIVEKGTFKSINEVPEGESLYLANYAQDISDLRTMPVDSVKQYWREWDATEYPGTGSTGSNASSDDLSEFMNQSKVEWMNEGYDVSDLNQNKFGLPTEYREAILRDAAAYKQRDDYMTTSFLIRRPDAVTAIYGPMLTSTWGQLWPYNYLIEVKYDKDYATGCMATAMAQIMRYHKKPTTYNWSDMPDSPNSESAAASVAQLMFDIAEDVHKKYGTAKDGGTTSNIDKALNTFNKFGYSHVKAESHNFYDILSQVRNSKNPVLMTGSNGTKFHAWVCDGVMATEYNNQIYLMILSRTSPYKYTKYAEPTPNLQSSVVYSFHMNWGENGLHDGWFSDNNIKTADGNAYSQKRNDIINIY